MLLTDTLSHLPSRANNTEIKIDLRVDTISFAVFYTDQDHNGDTERPDPVDCASTNTERMAKSMKTRTENSTQLLGFPRKALN